MLNDKKIKLIRPLHWEEAFLFWYQNEGARENWIQHAKERGFASWADWRLSAYAVPFECAKADWSLYEISEPAKIMPDFYGGPFRTWIERHYGGVKEMKFSDLAKMPAIQELSAIKSMIADYPSDKIITCLVVGDKIYTIEGMHRSCTLAVMNEQNSPAPEKLYFAIGKSKLKELPVVGRHNN